MEFSLSGVQNKVQEYYSATNSPEKTAAYAISSVAKAVYRATENALKKYPNIPVVFSGGVASNSTLREVMAPMQPVFSPPQYSTDNAMGIAVLTFRAREG